MTAPDVMTEHPSDETLAAFVDRRLNASERRAVVEHFADCGECRTFMNDLTDIRAMDDSAGTVVPFRKPGGWRVLAAAIAIAAGVLIVFSGPLRSRFSGGSMQDVVDVTSSLERRPTAGRLSAAFPYRPAAIRMRSGGGQTTIDDVQRKAIENEVARLQGTTSPDPHKIGLLLLYLGDREAIKFLSEAAKTGDAAKIDLAAALLERGTPADVQLALDLSQQSNAPSALWNRALASARLGRNDEAIAAWTAYLSADPSSPWAAEAKLELEKIKASSASETNGANAR